MKRYIILALMFMLTGSLLAGCLSSGPEKPLQEMATALAKKDESLFLAQMNVNSYAVSQIINRTQGDTALRALDSMGRMLGLGGMEDLLGSVMDMESKLREEYMRGVSTGELMLQCRNTATPDCPWVPESLQAAKVKELTPTTAVAQVTTPANITSWLALAKKGEQWLVVGQAPLEAQAAQYAAEQIKPAASPALQAPPKGDPKLEPKTEPKRVPQPQPVPEKAQEPVKL